MGAERKAANKGVNWSETTLETEDGDIYVRKEKEEAWGRKMAKEYPLLGERA